MKKLFATFLLAATLSLSACSTVYNASSCKSNLENKGYQVTLNNVEETMTKYETFDFKDLKLTGSLFASKGTGDDKDGMLAIFFESMEDADAFIHKEDTLTILNQVVNQIVGENLLHWLSRYTYQV